MRELVTKIDMQEALDRLREKIKLGNENLRLSLTVRLGAIVIACSSVLAAAIGILSALPRH